jgi:type VI secretion system secreted protein Hcp
VSYIAYLKLEGIAGDCADAGHRDWIVLDSFSHSLCGPQERGGRTNLSDVAISRLADRATPLLARSTAEGRHFKEAILELCTTDGTKPKFMELRFTNVRLTSYSLSGAPQSDAPTPYENLTLQFEKIEWLYFPDAFGTVREKESAVCRAGYSPEAEPAAV